MKKWFLRVGIAAVTLAFSLFAVTASQAATTVYSASGFLNGGTDITYFVNLSPGMDITATFDCPPASSVLPFMTVLDPMSSFVGNAGAGAGLTCAGGASGPAIFNFTAGSSGAYGFILANLGGVGNYTFKVVCNNCTSGIDDDRINPEGGGITDAAIYCTDDGGFDVYAISAEGEGSLAFHLSGDEVAASEDSNGHTLLASSGNISLYRLGESGKLQLVVKPTHNGKTYVYIWNGCPYQGGGHGESN